ncbi:hypothetical protein [Halorubrum vacuolatum]|uniref:Uncharacterized protein n=1 Tax=Halorubrum vacuolatum TaxID=63740 RepID=A0A238WL07_HALVU|nr:hypothetical protein [Halorubrum vacuolatum]SNR47250.1 hypothetical protein SAMN06264855_108116 [Halorubrum vacuolatum]
MPETATLIARLIDDAVDGVRAAETEMEASAKELTTTLDRPPEELVTDREVDEFLRSAYPDPADPTRTRVRVGAVYLPKMATALRDAGIDPGDVLDVGDGSSETAGQIGTSVREYAGTAVTRGADAGLESLLHGATKRSLDFPVTDTVIDDRRIHTGDDDHADGPVAELPGASSDVLEFAADREMRVPVLTERAVNRIRRAAAHELGKQRRETIAGMVKNGLPRAVTETMDLSMKVAFDERLHTAVPDYREADVGTVPEAIGSIDMRLRFDRRE